MTNTKTIQCPSCGSNSVSAKSATTYCCDHCETQFEIEAAKEDVTVNVTNNITYANGGVDKFDVFATFETEFDEIQFKRNSFIALAKDNDVPADIFESDFSPVQMKCSHFSKFDMTHHINYSCLIGVDRKEKYYVWETKTQIINGIKHEKQVQVEKVRTVTDWHPHSGSEEIRKQIIIRIKGDGDESKFHDILKTVQPIIITKGMKIAEQPAEWSANDKQAAKEQGESQSLQQIKNGLPGDRYKDFNVRGSTEYNGVVTYACYDSFLVMGMLWYMYSVNHYYHNVCKTKKEPESFEYFGGAKEKERGFCWDTK